MEQKTKPEIDVVAGIVTNTDNQILIAKRPEHLDQGGLWEFPGGKREAGESSVEALSRELFEELDIIVDDALPLMALRHEYPKKTVNLEFFEILSWSGEAIGKEGQQISWVAKNELEQYTFPAANKHVVRALRFPRVLLRIGTATVPDELLKNLKLCLERGYNNIIYSPPTFSSTERNQCQRLYRLCRQHGGQLIISAPSANLTEFRDAGLFIEQSLLSAVQERPISPNRLLLCECSDEDDLNRAKALNPDAVVLTGEGFDGHQGLFKRFDFPIMVYGHSESRTLDDALAMGCYGVTLDIDSLSLRHIIDADNSSEATKRSYQKKLDKL